MTTMHQRRARLSIDVSREARRDRKSTRLNSSHSQISYAVFCLKKKMDIEATGMVDASTSLLLRAGQLGVLAAPAVRDCGGGLVILSHRTSARLAALAHRLPADA